MGKSVRYIGKHDTLQLSVGDIYEVVEEDIHSYQLKGFPSELRYAKTMFKDEVEWDETKALLRKIQKAIAPVLANGGLDPDDWFYDLVAAQAALATHLRSM